MSINLSIFVVIFLVTLGICQIIYTIYRLRKRDGKLTINEAADSYTITITTNPEEIKKKKCIKLRVEKTGSIYKYK